MSVGSALHASIAENGKLLALEGDHIGALMHYREAMSMAETQGMPEVVFRHYLECVLESLELSGSYQDVLEYCDRAIQKYQSEPPAHSLARLDLGTIYQRRGLILLKLGEPAAAMEAFVLAQDTLASDGVDLPLATQLMRWIRARVYLTPERILQEQRRHKYFAVRKETVNSSRAIPLPRDFVRQPYSGGK